MYEGVEGKEELMARDFERWKDVRLGVCAEGGELNGMRGRATLGCFDVTPRYSWIGEASELFWRECMNEKTGLAVFSSAGLWLGWKWWARWRA